MFSILNSQTIKRNHSALSKVPLSFMVAALFSSFVSSKLEAGSSNKNTLYWQSFLEFNLADMAPEQYLQSSNTQETISLILKNNPTLLPDSVTDAPSAQKYFSYYPLAMSSELTYLNSKGSVYRVMVFDSLELEKMKTGYQKSLNLKWKDPDTQYVHAMKASVKMINPSNENYDSTFKILPYNSRKSIEEARVEVTDASNASELVNLKLMGTIEDVAQAVTDEARKSHYGHKVTKASFLRAMERSKKIFENDSLMLKFLEKVSSALTSLE